MTLYANRDERNLTERLFPTERPVGLTGAEIMKAQDPVEVRQIIGGSCRRLNYNGRMDIFQRGVNTTISGSSSVEQYVADRFFIGLRTNNYTISATRDTSDHPSEFNSCLKLTNGTGVAGTASSNVVLGYGPFEGWQTHDLAWGTPYAKDLTISFWVKSSIPGIYSIQIINYGTGNAQAFREYHIKHADSWQWCSVTFKGCTSLGTTNILHDRAMVVNWSLGAGPDDRIDESVQDWVTTGGNWRGTNDSVEWSAVTGATFQITGVQMETGPVATEFAYRSYQEEVALCQRYFCKSYGINVDPGTNTTAGLRVGRNFDPNGARSDVPGYTEFPVSMRTSPSLTFYTKAGTVNKVNRGSASGGSIGSNESTLSFGVTGPSGIGYLSLNPSVPAASFYYYHYTAGADFYDS